jgi:hypothetical protein
MQRRLCIGLLVPPWMKIPYMKLKNFGLLVKQRDEKDRRKVNYVLYLLLMVEKPGRQVAYNLRALNGPERA